jgi:hypothetical protein
MSVGALNFVLVSIGSSVLMVSFGLMWYYISRGYYYGRRLEDKD